MQFVEQFYQWTKRRFREVLSCRPSWDPGTYNIRELLKGQCRRERCTAWQGLLPRGIHKRPRRKNYLWSGSYSNARDVSAIYVLQ